MHFSLNSQPKCNLKSNHSKESSHSSVKKESYENYMTFDKNIEEITKPANKGRHRRTKTMIISDNSPCLNFHRVSESNEIVNLKASNQNKPQVNHKVQSTRNKANSYYQKYIKDKSKGSMSSTDRKKKSTKTIQISFDTILEEND